MSYGNAVQMTRAIREYIQTGVAGVHELCAVQAAVWVEELAWLYGRAGR